MIIDGILVLGEVMPRSDNWSEQKSMEPYRRSSSCCLLTHHFMHNRTAYWRQESYPSRRPPFKRFTWSPLVHPNLWRFPCCSGTALNTEVVSNERRARDVLKVLGGRTLLLVCGDSVSMQVLTAILCYLERHASEGMRHPAVVHKSWPEQQKNATHHVTPIASYASGLDVAHASLPQPALSWAQLSVEIRAAFGHSIDGGSTANGQRSNASTAAWREIHLVLIGGGSPMLVHHWATLPRCDRALSHRSRHILIAADRPCANSYCFARYLQMANRTLAPLLRTATSGSISGSISASVTLTVTSAVPSHFASQTGEWHSSPLNASLPHAGSSDCVAHSDRRLARGTRDAAATLACRPRKHGAPPSSAREREVEGWGASGEAAWAWRDLILRDMTIDAAKAVLPRTTHGAAPDGASAATRPVRLCCPPATSHSATPTPSTLALRPLGEFLPSLIIGTLRRSSPAALTALGVEPGSSAAHQHLRHRRSARGTLDRPGPEEQLGAWRTWPQQQHEARLPALLRQLDRLGPGRGSALRTLSSY